MSEVERTGRKEGEGSGARRRGTRGPGGVYPGKPGPKGPGDTRTLRSMQGRKLPHVRKPLLLPPVIGPDILSQWLRSVSPQQNRFRRFLSSFSRVVRSCPRP